MRDKLIGKEVVIPEEETYRQGARAIPKGRAAKPGIPHSQSRNLFLCTFDLLRAAGENLTIRNLEALSMA